MGMGWEKNASHAREGTSWAPVEVNTEIVQRFGSH